MLFGAAVALAATLAGPDADPGSLAVLPLQVQGELDERAQAQMRESVIAGLARAEFSVSPAEPAYEPAGCNAACLAQIRHTAHVERLVLVSVSVEDRMYRIDVRLVGEDGGIEAEIKRVCEVCGRQEVADVLDSVGVAIRRSLDRLPEEEPPPKPVVVPDPGPAPRRRDARKIAGGVTLGVGIAALAAGVPLLVLHGRPYRRECSGNDVDFAGRCRQLYDTLAGGAVAVALGAGLVATGIALLVVAKKKPRNRVRAAIGPSGVGLVIDLGKRVHK